MPVRRSLLAEKAMPSARAAGTGAKFRHKTPKRMAISSALTPGKKRAPIQASTAPIKATMIPGSILTTFSPTVCSGDKSLAVFILGERVSVWVLSKGFRFKPFRVAPSQTY